MFLLVDAALGNFGLMEFYKKFSAKRQGRLLQFNSFVEPEQDEPGYAARLGNERCSSSKFAILRERMNLAEVYCNDLFFGWHIALKIIEAGLLLKKLFLALCQSG